MESDNDFKKARVYSEKPDINALRNDFDRVRGNLSWWLDRAQSNRNVRFNLWPGKTDDGRKHGLNSFPWDKASDLETFFTDGLINSDVAMLKSSLRKSNLVASPVEANDTASAGVVTQYLRWLMFNRMSELSREAEILANYVMEKGLGIMGVYWKREVQKVYRTISKIEIMQMPQVALALQNGDAVTASDFFLAENTDVSEDMEEKLAAAWDTEEEVEYTAEEVISNRPHLKAYELGREILIDSNTSELQDARGVYCLHFFTPEELKAKQLEGWDPAFIDNAIERFTGDTPTIHQNQGVINPSYDTPHNYEGLVQVIQSFRKEVDENGVPVMSQTIFTERGDEELYGFHEVYRVNPAVYPFVAFTRERVSNRMMDSRGLPEILRGFEYAIKTELDSRRDRASLSTVPPIEYLVGRSPGQVGPGSKIPVRRRNEVGYMEIPKYSPASAEVEEAIRTQGLKLAGRPTDETDAVEANIIRQSMVNNWLTGWKEVVNQVWSLHKTYGDDVTWFRVTNNEKGVELAMDKVGDKYDIEITWDTINMDQEKQTERLAKIGEIMAQFDRNGQADFGEYLRVFVEALDPNLAAKLVLPKEAATDREVEETSADLAKIASGQVVNVPETVNSDLRMKVIQSYLQGTEDIPAQDVQKRWQEDEAFKARLDAYVKQIQHQAQQRQNALTGKLGTPPGNVPGTSQPPAQGAAPQAPPAQAASGY